MNHISAAEAAGKKKLTPPPAHGGGEPAYMVGIDVGSTTTKVAVFDRCGGQALRYDYRRHHALQRESVKRAVLLVEEVIGDAPFQLAMTGSGAAPLASALEVPMIQEVVASSIAVRRLYPSAAAMIELGGQDAKIVFFGRDEAGRKQMADMRMNGVCAGGTGAFIDEVAEILHIPVEELSERAEQGRAVYDISGRCGVFAKTDIQPLQAQGVGKEDLALSTYHAIARQTVGGLARGREILGPVIFAGGVFRYHPRLVRVFQETLGLTEPETILPEHPEHIPSSGAAMACRELFPGQGETDCPSLLQRLAKLEAGDHREHAGGPLYFQTDEEKRDFLKRHPAPQSRIAHLPEGGQPVRAFLGIDSGSTTTKFVLMNEEGRLLWSHYGSNEGDPLMTARAALLEMDRAFRENGSGLQILRVCTTGYSERLFADAFIAEDSCVETIAHGRAASHFAGDVSFILDIGGQDMKGIWMDQGVITSIVVNEACSSGCGSFLSSFAGTLHIPEDRIAAAAFASTRPAILGSRCTVFMNSSIISEQRNGCSPEDIMAGLCRSLIENVFSKVIRVSNLDALGQRIMVQGGTFMNDAVLRAMEQYVGREVIRAPYPGLMGAIGAALTARDHYRQAMAEGREPERTFIGMKGLEAFSYTRQSGLSCPLCANHCRRSVIRFGDGRYRVTGNRCERGAVLEPVRGPEGSADPNAGEGGQERQAKAPNLFERRISLLFRKTDPAPICGSRDVTIGIPRVLSFWDSYPFWDAFWRSLGFDVLLSPLSSRKLFEKGLPAVTSDTECFPAKLVHGHVRWLEEQGADRIFMPVITELKSENRQKTSQSVCALVKGYPLVMKNSDNPAARSGIPLDTPLFAWYTDRDRQDQLRRFMKESFGVSEEDTGEAIRRGDLAQRAFREELMEEADRIMEEVRREDGYAVVLASQPYHNDPLICHDLPDMLASMGLPVLTADSIRQVCETDLSHLRLNIVNNYHARTLASAVIAARDPHLEYMKTISFGCGHEAYLVDEIIRVMREISGKVPLVLKVDESDAKGPLQIRVRSFAETVRARRAAKAAGPEGKASPVKTLEDPYPVKFTKEDKRIRTLLIPNSSHAFSRIMAAAVAREGVRTVALPIGRREAIRLGKRYVHNDICFPAQIVIGEILAALQSGRYDPDRTAVGMAKYVGDCRLTHYSALLRKALDDAGFPQIPIWTNDTRDDHNLHPGMKFGLMMSAVTAFGLPMIDALERLLRKIRPYETQPGRGDAAFEEALDLLCEGIEASGLAGMGPAFAKGIERMKEVPYDRSALRPQVVIVGEYLLNFHPGANHDIERYLEKNGFEILEARMSDVIQKSYFYERQQVRRSGVRKKAADRIFLELVDGSFRAAHALTDRIASAHPLYEAPARLQELAEESEPVIPSCFDTGEGLLIPAEIIHDARRGCRNFIVLQPFGCLPNHIVGRGIVKKLGEMFPQAQILSLDYDPDMSFANIENRLQMMIHNERMR